MSAITPIPVTQKAVLRSLSPGSKPITVHFNPASLVYTVENSSKQQSAGPKKRQFAAQFSGKLTMDLQFDTTGSGEDVRATTGLVAKFMQASSASGTNPSSGNAQAPPVLSFEWGAYEFKGTMESFKETIDFFSADGIPLRSLVSVGLARQDNVFDENFSSKKANVGGPFTTSSNNSVVPTGKSRNSSNLTTLATVGGDPNAVRAVASANGLDSLRFTGGASVAVGAGIQLNAAAGFSASAGAGAGLSIGGGAGLSIGGGAGISAGAGLSFGASAGVVSSASLQISAGVGGGALFGGQASAGVPATAGAFAGLELGRATVSTTTRLNPLRMLPATVSTDVSTGQNASFQLGGAANVGSGFSTDVGASFSFSDRLVFDQE
jgi:hypothetical protein